MPKKTRKTGKEKASDIPSWARGKTRDPKEDLTQAAERIMDEHYGKDKWKKGTSREYSQIRKYLSRKEK
jgi:hypothetical protein